MLLPSSLLPEQFLGWFTQKNWVIYPHQLEMIDFWQRGHSTLLIAPTGAGKTLSGFLPSLIDSNGAKSDGIHTIYISPLKALAVDIARNLEAPIAEMGLDITIETRTGDTPQSRRARIRSQPPHILLTTPESLELMLSWPDAASLFGSVKTIIIDEIHTVLGSKRGDLLSLSLATLRGLAPISQSIGLSATVADPQQLTPLLSAHPDEVVVFAPPLEKVIELSVMTTDDDSLPWAGHSALYAMPRIYDLLRKHKTTLVFVNTRAQAEMVFQALWHLNDDHLKIGIHHGSLDVQQRRRVEAMMADGALDAVVATSSLDLGIDWADIDLVIQVGAPKGVARLIQRVGRAGHRLDAPSRAVLVPANRFEMLEGLAARISVQKRALDRFDLHEGALDILAQYLVGRAVAGPFDADQLYTQIRTAAAYRTLRRDIFDKVLDFIATGGYALDHYSQFHRIVKGIDGLWRLTSKQVATRWRMNIGAIVETATLKVRIKGGPILGEVEEYFVQNLSAGDSFMFGGRILEFIGIRALVVEARSAASSDPKIPAYAGGRLPLSPNLAESVRSILNDDDMLAHLPASVRSWLVLQKLRSALPGQDKLLVETFKRGAKFYLVAYCFAGRNAHQTLGMLMTRRMERAGLKPLGFVATDYAIAIWSLTKVSQPETLLSPDILGDDLEEWMAETSLMKRSFRQVATIAGLIDKRIPGMDKTGRQVTVNSDLIYDVLRQHQPDHLLLQATRADAARGMTDIKRLSELLTRFDNNILHKDLPRISPLSVPLILEVGRESVTSSAVGDMLADLEQTLLKEAMVDDPS